MSSPDVIVVGAGIVGAACARELAAAGLAVTVLEATPRTAGGATGAGMGHLIVTDDSEAQFQLCRVSQMLWEELAPELPSAAQHDQCGCVWVAADAEEMDMARSKATFFSQRGVPVEVLDEVALREAEPQLRPGLAGGLAMPQDSIIYPPVAAQWLLQRAVDAGTCVETGVAVESATEDHVTLVDGTVLPAGHVVLAAGDRALDLLPEPIPGAQIRPRKGHLAITVRVPGFAHHQVAELGYFGSARSDSDASVAFNVQARPTGQLLIGSSRQYGVRDSRVEPALLARMLRRATEYLPRLDRIPIIRTWTGFRAATVDKLPLIGPVPGRARLLLASGHEGLGITTSLGTGRLIADMILGRESAIDPYPYRPDRFAGAGA